MNQYEHIYEFAFISDKIKEIFDKYLDSFIEISFREVQNFRGQLCTWERKFPKPSKSKLATVISYKELIDFYSRKLDFSIFEAFDYNDRKVIESEIAAYASREVMDWEVGFRLRNWAELGIFNPKWIDYQEDINGYYQKVISDQKKKLITKYQKQLYETGNEKEVEDAIRKCAGELFFEVDKIRLMSLRSLNFYLENIYLKLLSSKRKRYETEVPSDLSQEIQESFDFMGLPYFADFIDLKNRYRELALSYHPDKGGDINKMKKLNSSYKTIADYFMKVKKF